MIDLLKETTAILVCLHDTIEISRKYWEALDSSNPGFIHASEHSWAAREARYWLYGTTNLEEINELERWHPKPPSLSDLANANARECVQYWRDWLCMTDAYYEPFGDFNFQQPEQDETLMQFLSRMKEDIEQEGCEGRLTRRAFYSFLFYIRKINQESAFEILSNVVS